MIPFDEDALKILFAFVVLGMVSFGGVIGWAIWFAFSHFKIVYVG